jgi:hypothetical protein
VGAQSAFNLRQVRLADGFANLLLDFPDDLLLGHFPAQSAQRSFYFPQVPQFFSQSHRHQRSFLVSGLL